LVAAGKGFVEAVKVKTEEQLDEDVRMESEPVQEDPTLKPFDGFNAETDCGVLMKAMKGFGKLTRIYCRQCYKFYISLCSA
jgi:hypothetical protein